MRHGVGKKTLNMPSSQRSAVIRNLMISMLKCGKVQTTLAKAKVFVPLLEKMITRAKEKNLSNTRYFIARLNKESVNNIYEIASKMSDRKGGYTRITKNWQRYGDSGEVATVEFVF